MRNTDLYKNEALRAFPCLGFFTTPLHSLGWTQSPLGQSSSAAVHGFNHGAFSPSQNFVCSSLSLSSVASNFPASKLPEPFRQTEGNGFSQIQPTSSEYKLTIVVVQVKYSPLSFIDAKTRRDYCAHLIRRPV